MLVHLCVFQWVVEMQHIIKVGPWPGILDGVIDWK